VHPDLVAAAADTLADQERIKLWLGAGAAGLVVLLTAFGWFRARRRQRGSGRRRRELLELANSLIPPEVRRERPDARWTELSSDSERSLWRRHGVMLAVLVCLPIVGVASMVVGELEDALAWVGEHLLLVLAVLVVPVLLFVRSQLRLAARSVDEHSQLLGLDVTEAPGIGVGVRGGAIKPVPAGGLQRTGIRYGRKVTVGTTRAAGGALTTTHVDVASPDANGRAEDHRWVEAPAEWAGIDPGPGDVRVRTGADGVLVERTVSVTTSSLDVLEAELCDLRLAEQLADHAV
jgi:hypothetical protein